MYMEDLESEKAVPARNLSETWSQVATAVTAVDATLGRWLMDTHGIGLTEYHAVLHLSRAPDKELRLNDLAHKVGLNQSSVTRLVGRLESKELTIRDRCPDDGRGVYAVITDHGVNVLAAIREPYEAKIAELLQNATKHYPNSTSSTWDRAFGAISKFIS